MKTRRSAGQAYQPPGITARPSVSSSMNKARRRSLPPHLYTFWRRSSRFTLLFDVASEQSAPFGKHSNTPLHALDCSTTSPTSKPRAGAERSTRAARIIRSSHISARDRPATDAGGIGGSAEPALDELRRQYTLRPTRGNYPLKESANPRSIKTRPSRTRGTNWRSHGDPQSRRSCNEGMTPAARRRRDRLRADPGGRSASGILAAWPVGAGAGGGWADSRRLGGPAAETCFGRRRDRQTAFRSRQRGVASWQRHQLRPQERPDVATARVVVPVIHKSAAIHYRPLGMVGVITPWNYPIILVLMPVVQRLWRTRSSSSRRTRAATAKLLHQFSRSRHA